VLGLSSDKQTPAVTARLAVVMKNLGWSEPDQMRICGRNQRGYSRKLVEF
jgi:hypothetical protein